MEQTDRGKLTGRRLQKVRTQILVEQGGACLACGQPPERPILEHILSRSDGGTNDRSNLCVLCLDCAKEKTRREQSGLPPEPLPRPGAYAPAQPETKLGKLKRMLREGATDKQISDATRWSIPTVERLRLKYSDG
jgi:hypothetical protein